MNLDRLITETVRRQLLLESAKEDRSRNAARKMVIAKFGCTEAYANKVVEEIRVLVGLEDKMRKFLKGCTRMFLNGEFKDQQVLGDFKDALNKIKNDGHIKEFDSNLRRLDQEEGTVNSAKDIISIFKPEIDRERAEQRQKLSGMTFVPNQDYEIVKINSFEEASEYSDYTSWCVTKADYRYDGYTNNGINQFYFCLEKGFENIEDDGDFNDKTDEYALSMLAILVNPEGELIHCTNRKNNDQSTLNPMGISELVGRNFYETFKPNTTWRDTLEYVKNRLANGVPVEDVFDEVRSEEGLVLVCLLERWNILGEGNTFLCDKWYDYIWNFHEGFARILDKTNGYNFINRYGKEICDRWYDGVDNFSEGFARVFDRDKGFNFINHDGNEVCDRWYDIAYGFSEGFAAVKDENKGWNFINRDSKEICDRWYDNVGSFSEGFAWAWDKTKGYNFINSDGKEICDRWYYSAYGFSEGFAAVKDENKGWNFINRDSKEICDRWYDEVWDFSEGFAKVKDENKGWNFINRDGEEICDRWYDEVWDFSEGLAKVKDKNKGWNFINRDGEEICDRWYDEVWGVKDGFAMVYDKGVFYWVREDGVLYDYNTMEPIENKPTQMAESLINRLVRDVLSENRKQYYL